MSTRVLHVLPRPGGGGELYMRSLIEGLGQYEHTPFLLSDTHDPWTRPPAQALRRLPRLRRTVSKHDLVHVHGAPALLVSLPALGRRPTVFTTHGLNLLRSPGPRSKVAAAVLRLAAARGVRAIAVSESDRDQLIAAVPRFAGSVTVVLNGAPPSSPRRSGSSAAELGLPETGLVLLFVGELAEHKQPRQLLEAVRLARDRGADVTAVLVGEGQLRPSLEALADDFAILLGERQDVPDLLAATDAFVLPSLHEGMSLALLEAMANAKPVVVSDIPANREAVGDAGIVLPVGDVGGLANAIVTLADDDELRQRMGAAARDRIADRFDLDRMLRETARVYEQLLGPG